ncbi:MAG: hypothetical protein UU76_C0021G0004 [Parcubacteria group bacterium GW2011_GWC1_41_7]|nr:MAG: hypothetical protein UU76_C0021G0004 [Parcubacteria group bacterium GW2011_GWC1_41_7]
MSKFSIRKFYLYLFALIGLILIVVGSVRLVNLALTKWVFPQADVYYEYPAPKPVSVDEKVRYQEPSKEELEAYRIKERTARRQRDAAGAIALLLVGFPLYGYHWKMIKSEEKKDRD